MADSQNTPDETDSAAAQPRVSGQSSQDVASEGPVTMPSVRSSDSADSNRRVADWTKRLTLVTAFLVLVGVAQMVTGILQFVSMQGQLNEMRGSSEQSERAIGASERLASLAADANAVNATSLGQARMAAATATAKADEANSIARTTVNAATEATIRANRAWVSVEQPNLIRELDQHGDVYEYSAEVELKNTGKEPAVEIRHNVETFWFYPTLMVPQPLTPPDVGEADMRYQQYPENHTCDSVSLGAYLGTAWPNREKPYRIEGSSVFPPSHFEGNRAKLGVHGCIRYETFGQTHFTEFCFIDTPDLDDPAHKLQWSLCQGKGQQDAD